MRWLIGIVIVTSACAFAQSAARGLAFISADVHRSPDGIIAWGSIHPGHDLEFRAITMRGLISTAYDVGLDQVLGEPWMSVDRFDVIAQTPPESTVPEQKAMLRRLLEERFNLRVRMDTKPFPAYILKPAKRGFQLTPVASQGEGSCEPFQDGSAIAYLCHKMSIAGLASRLPSMAPVYFDLPVVDRTGKDGVYDFNLRWAPRGTAGGDGAAIPLFDYLDRHLGIEVATGTAEERAVVVENVNANPTENEPGLQKSLRAPPADFDVAEIHASPGDEQPKPPTFEHGVFRAPGVPLRALIAVACKLDQDRVISGDKWLDSQAFDIVAKTDPLVSFDGMRPMLRRFLEDRFKLKMHREVRPAAVFALTAGNHLKLNSGDAMGRPSCKFASTSGMRIFTCQNISMRAFAERLADVAPGYLDHPLVDSTGLDGVYTFSINWSPVGLTFGPARDARDQTPQPGGVPAGAANNASTPSGATTVFDALERLGLKLVKQRQPMPVAVIDETDRTSWEN